ncbi:hypothetical protein [Candidatus Nitrosopumilus sediminis]|nr:hypothetical protein [Candidatus Nitrosopumilus sediminis]
MLVEISFFEWFAIFGIVLEIFGFLFVLWFWRVPTYPSLNKWFQLLKIYKIFFRTKRYENKLTDIVEFDTDEKQIQVGTLGLSGPEYSPIVPRSFIPFWNRMRWFGFILVMCGLVLQIVQMLDVNT